MKILNNNKIYGLQFMEILLKYANQINVTAGIILGSALQYLLSKHKGLRAILTISISAVFLAFYIIHPILSILETVSIPILNLKIDVTSGSFAYSMLMTSSSLISAEIISFIILILPDKLKEKALKTIGIREEYYKKGINNDNS